MFRKDFIWGTASASYQVEGAAYEDGRGLSVWDIMCKKPSTIRNGESGDVACDHYHKLEEDLDMMKKMGIKAYRFSVSWTRIFPNGIGKVNEKGVEFYDRLINGLVKRGIRPFMTIFHWDYPQALFNKGGWLNEESPIWFEKYAEFLTERYSDRVKDFITINEPQCITNNGHRFGDHAPSVRYYDDEMLLVAYNMLKAHGLAVKKMREVAKQKINISISIVGNAKVPYSNSKKDIEAAKKASQELRFKESSDIFWMDIIHKGEVPYKETVFKKFNKMLKKGDLELFSQPLDTFCVNMYASDYIRATKDGGYEVVPKKQGAPVNSLRWNVVPEVLYWGTKAYYERYHRPIIVSENGYCTYDFKTVNGDVIDYNRINFMQQYLLQLKRSAEEGTDIAGYFYWSIMDNFEWAHGYDERFGLVYVDYATQERTIKQSGKYYKKIIETNGEYLSKSILPKSEF